MKDVHYITVGKIVNTHGRRGLLKVLPMTDFPGRFSEMNELLVLRHGSREKVHIERSFQHKKFIIMSLQEISDMNAAEGFKGALLQIHRDQLTELPGDSFYIFDIIGCSVFDMQGNFLGAITDVIQTGANDVYVAEDQKRRQPLLIPALKTVVRRVNIPEKRIDVELPEGLEPV